MNKTRIERHLYHENWALPSVPGKSNFPAERALLERLAEYTGPWFSAFPFPYSDDDLFNYYLTFSVQALELLPLHTDLAFDSLWRANDSLWDKHVLYTRENKPFKTFAPLLAEKAVADQDYLTTFLPDLFQSIPVQSCEYIVSRLFRSDPNIFSSDSGKIYRRLSPDKISNNTIKLVKSVATQYSAPISDPSIYRKASTLLRLIVAGQNVKVNGEHYQLSESERISFLLNALLYTFRNDRFHGSMQPPFKSSVGKLKTYAHVHYCFLWAHFLFLQALAESGIYPGKTSEIATNMAINIQSYKDFYGTHLTK